MPPMGAFGQSFALNASAQAPVETATGRKSLRGYVPAGTYAPAIVLTGADAATNVRGREDPVPVLFRITGSGTTAGRSARGGARVALTGCTVQGSATGDLSAERVMVRLTTITCQNSDGTISEAAIRGYMTHSGKAGARGQVVSREGNLVNNAAIAGALYYPQAGIINPAEIAPIASIYLAVWVAIGGRGRLYGAVIGAAFVSLLSSWFTGGGAPAINLGFYTVQWTDWWLVLLGLSFVLVTLFFPKGIGGLFDHLVRRQP